MRKARPRINISEVVRLKCIAIYGKTEANEVLDALIHWAYQLPREQWIEILHTYRRKKREEERQKI